MDDPREEFEKKYSTFTRDTGSFYRDKTWELLMGEVRQIKEGQEEMAKDVANIKAKIAWMFGIVTGITFIVNIGWQWVLKQIQK